MNNISLQFAPQELDTIVAALREIPWKFANPILFSIEQQTQVAKAPVEAKVE